MMFKTFPAWRWQGLNRQGLKVRGLAFQPPAALRVQLWEQGIRLQRVRLQRQGVLRGSALRQWQLQFTRAWLVLIEAGIAQLEVFRMLAQQATHAQAAQWLTYIAQALEDGHSLQHSLQRCGAGFDAQYCRLIEVGERAGQLPTVLQRLALRMAEREAQRQAGRKALIYPVSVLLVALVVMLAMLYFVVPQFSQLYAQMQVALPGSTQRLLDIALALQQPRTWLLAAPLLLAVPLTRQLPRLCRHHLTFSELVYRLPHIGLHLQQSHLRDDLATLGLAYRSSLPLDDACGLTANSTHSAYLRHYWRRCQTLLGAGSSLYEVLQQNPYIEAKHLQTLRLGEDSGRLTEQIDRVVQQLTAQVSARQQKILKLLEPLFLVITGTFTAAILMALYLPLFQLGQLVG